MTEERKLVTVLFADIVGSTAIGASHDPEVVRRTLSRAFSEVRKVLETHGGTVEKFIGDAVFAIFGVPKAHDDDADRGVRAAFALRDRIAALNADNRFALELRIGVNSGQVVTGDTGETLVTGEAVNAGARLQSAAAPGEILVGALTHELTEGAVRYGPRREIDAKGLGRLPVWPATELASALPSQHRGITGLRAPLIGRDDELRLLVDSHRKVATEQRAALVTVYGNAGVGKSRLVAEFVEAIGTDRVRRGRCLPYGEGITFWPIVEILQADAGITALDSHADATIKLRSAVLATFGEASDDADAVARRLSVLAGTASREAVLPDMPSETMPQELQWGIRRYLEKRAAAAPLVLIFDDIHRAEGALLDLIEHLAEWSRAPLFLLCMARPDLRELRAGWGGGLMNASAIRLEPLTDEEAARLIGELLAIDALPERLRQQVITRSEGNPLYVEEFLRMLIDGGHVTKRDGRFVAASSLETLVVPATLQGLIAARLDTAPSAVKRALQRGAIVGKVFWPEAVLAQGPIDGRIDELLRNAARRDLVSELDERGLGGGRAWTFKHILIRDVAYDAIPKTERAAGHGAFGRWLEETAGARVDEYAEIIAYHAEQAFELARELGDEPLEQLGRTAYGHLMRTATRAKERGDLAAAFAFFRRALAIAEAIDLPAAEQLTTRAHVAVARAAVEGPQDVLGEIATLVAELRLIAPTSVFVDLLQQLSYDRADKDVASAAALDREAVAAARAIGDPDTLVRAIFRSQWVPWVAGDLVAERALLLEALQLSESTGATRHLSEVLGGLAGGAAMRGDLVEAVEYAGRSNERAIASGSSLQRCRASTAMAWSAYWRGDVPAAIALARGGVGFAIDAGVRLLIATHHMTLGELLDLAGELPEARAEDERAIDGLAGDPWTGQRAEARTRLVKTLISLGDRPEARRQAELARAEVLEDDVYTLTTSAAALAAVCAAEGNAVEAEQLFRQALETIGRTGYVLLRMDLSRDFASFLIDRGRPSEARPLLEAVRRFYDTPVTPLPLAEVEALLQRCAAVPR
ncbi:MAG TPA: adenylate/guanylate cyclase domain-containing protein [Candidatus Limnocylindria bacterium]